MMDVGRLQGFDVSYIPLTTLLWYVCHNINQKKYLLLKIVSDLALYLLCCFL
jgi:hypothetical protein